MAMDPLRIDTEYDRLVRLIYQGALEQQPWQSALPALREALDAQVVSLVLRPPSDHDQGVILNSLRPNRGEAAAALPLLTDAGYHGAKIVLQN